tara:strand:- start:415 stop:528 length:114 start_codon:yes stop_codon:yes gene_type:complete
MRLSARGEVEKRKGDIMGGITIDGGLQKGAVGRKARL